MFCGKCGKEVNSSEKYCPCCGSEINTISYETSQHGKITQQNENDNDKKLEKEKEGNIKPIAIKVGIAFVVLILFIICVIVLGKAKTDEPIDKNIKTTQAGSCEQNNDVEDSFGAKITEASPFSNGIAKVTCDVDGKLNDYLIDKNGDVLYAIDSNESLKITPSNDNSLGYIYDDATNTHKIINTQGLVIKELKNGEIDEILACGGDFVLVYKCESDIDSKKHLFGAIDSTGEWSMPLTDIGIDFEGVTFDRKAYAGSDIFDIRLSCTFKDEGWQSVYSFNVLINANNGKVTFFMVGLGYQDYKEWVSFDSKGNDYFICQYSGSAYNAFVSDKPLHKNGEEIPDLNDYRTSHDFILKSDGTWESISESSPMLNEFIKTGDRWLKMDSDCIEIYNTNTDATAKYTGYSLDTIEQNDVFFLDEYSLLPINGKDGKNYFTIINDRGEQKFEPIVGTIASFATMTLGSDLSCFAYRNENSLYNVIDIDGNILCNDLNYSYVSHFSEGLAVAESEEGVSYIDKNGTVVLDTIQIPIDKE